MRYFFPLLSSCMLLALCVPTTAQQQDKKPRVDAYGDPLPEGAVARLGTVRWRHEGDVIKAVFSPDGKKIASASERFLVGDKFVYLWDTNGKKLWRNSAGAGDANPTKIVRCLMFSPDGSKVVAGVGKRPEGLSVILGVKPVCQLVMFDTETGKIRTEYTEQDQPVVAAAFVDNGKTLVCIDETGKFRAWEVATQKLVREWQVVETGRKGGVGVTPRSIAAAAIAPTGDKLAIHVAQPDAGKGKGELQVLDVLHSKLIFRADMDVPPSISALGRYAPKPLIVFSTDGNTLAVADAKGIVICDTATGKIETEFRNPLPYGISFSADGKTFVLDYPGSPGSFTVYDMATRKVIKEIKEVVAFGNVVSALSRDGSSLLTVSSYPSSKEAGVLGLLDTQIGMEKSHSTGHGSTIVSLSFSEGGAILNSGETSRLLSWGTKDWSLKTSISSADAVKQMPNSDDSTFVGSADFSHFLVKPTGKPVEVRERATGKTISTLDLQLKDSPPNAMLKGWSGVFSPGHSIVVVGEKKQDHVFNVRTGKRMFTIDGIPAKWRRAFSPDDKRLAVADLAGEIAIYDIASGKITHRFERAGMGKASRFGAMAFSPDGHYLASWGEQDGPICIWSLQTGKRIHEIAGKPQAKVFGMVAGLEYALVFSPDSRLLGSTHREDNSIIQVWEIATGNLRHEFKGHTGSVAALAWSPDGRLLASGSADTTVLVWDVWGSEKGK